MKRILIALSFILFFSEITFAQVYKWVDEKGVAYFTDDITQVPEKYRSGAKKIGSSEEMGEIKGDGESSPKRKEDTYKDRLGRGEDYWKGLMEDWKKKLRELQDNMEILRNKYNELTEKYNDSKSTVERGNLRKERDLVKNEMDGNRLRAHNEYTNQGRLFIMFATLVLSSYINNVMSAKKLFKAFSMKEMLVELKKIKHVQLSNTTPFVSEVSKKQKNILEAFNIPFEKLHSY